MVLSCNMFCQDILIIKNGVVQTSSKSEKVKHELRVTSSNPRVTSSNPRVASSNPRVTSSNPRVTSSNPRVSRSNL